MENTDRHWQLWGELDPYRAVCFPNGQDCTFWKSGEDHIQLILTAQARFYPQAPHNTAIDFGCGVGRLLRPLALYFSHVIGIDISAGMLAEARRNVPTAELTDHIPRQQASLVHSYLVLQHIPPRRGIEIVRRLASCVEPQGVIAVQVPVETSHLSNSLAYRVKHALPACRFAFNLLQGKRLREPLMQMNAYSFKEMFGALQGEGITDIVVVPMAESLITSVMVFGTKG
jgi:trans-aconitate methyltransferase